MQGIFQKENTDKALKYGIYRHLPTYEKIIRNLVSFYIKDNIKFVLLPVANQRFKIDVDRVGGGFRRRPLTPPDMRFRIRRFS